MTICNDLREAVLQAAMQGKLTKQRQTDSSAKGLLEKIIEQRKTAGRIKSTEPIVFENIDIPENWSAIRCGNCLGLFDGEKVSGINLPYLEAKYLRGKISATMKQSGEMVKQGAKIILVDGENSGEVFSVPEDGILGSTFKVLFIPESINEKFVMYFLEMHRDMLKNNKKGAAIPHLNKEVFNSLIIPVPPIEEQQRIVAIVDNLMAKIDDLEKTENELEMLKKDFPEDMKASILQAAMQGKLTKQLPSDGDASELIYTIKNEKEALVNAKKIKKEKPLSPISEDDTPFDIPENWKWIRFGEILTVISGTSYDKTEIRKNGLRIIRGGNLQDNRLVAEDTDVFLDEEKYGDKQKQVKKNDIVVVASTGSLTAIGRPAFADDNPKACMQIGAFLRIIRPINDLLYPYIKIVFLSSYYRNWISASVSGIGIRNLKEQHITNLIVPLPPLAEQIRIVDKINQLLPLCEILQEGVE